MTPTATAAPTARRTSIHANIIVVVLLFFDFAGVGVNSGVGSGVAASGGVGALFEMLDLSSGLAFALFSFTLLSVFGCMIPPLFLCLPL